MTIRRWAAAGVLAAAGTALSAQAPPATEIYLAPLTWTGQKVTVGRPVNITNNPGYDNQPQFLTDSTGVLFSSNRDGVQTDIYRYDIAPKKMARVTNTPDNEYSPTLTPDGRTFTTVRGAAQRLWRFTLDGVDAGLAWSVQGLIGYHVWVSPTQIATFILGQPATLQLLEVIEKDIGRSLLIRPNRGTVSFIHKPQGAPWQIKEFNPATKAVTVLTPTLEGSEDLAWTPDGAIVMGQKTKLFLWREGASGWTEIADLGKQQRDPRMVSVENITRLTVSPDGKWIAVVAQAPAR